MSVVTGSSGFDVEGAGVRANSDWTDDGTTEGKTSPDLSDVDGSGMEEGNGGMEKQPQLREPPDWRLILEAV